MKETDHPILNEILSNIEKDGKCEVSYHHLSKDVFSRKTEKDWETRAQILLWAVSKDILYHYIGEGDDTKVLFFKRR